MHPVAPPKAQSKGKAEICSQVPGVCKKGVAKRPWQALVILSRDWRRITDRPNFPSARAPPVRAPRSHPPESRLAGQIFSRYFCSGSMDHTLPDIAYSYYARAMLRNYGKDAAIHAASAAIAMIESGDMFRYAIWRRIMDAIFEIERKDREESKALI